VEVAVAQTEGEVMEVEMPDILLPSPIAQSPQRRSYHEFFSTAPQRMRVRPSTTPHDVWMLQSVGVLPSRRGQENINPNIPRRTPSTRKRPLPAQRSLRKNPSRRTAHVGPPSRTVDSLFSPNPRDSAQDVIPSSIDESADVSDDADEKNTPSSNYELADNTGDDEKNIPSSNYELADVPDTDEKTTHLFSPIQRSEVLHPLVRTTAEGHTLRIRVQMERRVFPGCALTTEEAVACFAVAMVNTTAAITLTCYPM
jgi:hypothetical protein